MDFVCDNPKCPLHIPLFCVDPDEAMKEKFSAPEKQVLTAALQAAGAMKVMEVGTLGSFKDPDWPKGLAQTNHLELDFDIIRLRYAPRQIGYTKFKFLHEGEPIEGRLCTTCFGAIKLLLGV